MNVTVPPVDVTAADVVIPPTDVAEVTDTLLAAFIAAAIVIPRPELNVIVPSVELIVPPDVVIKSPVVVCDVKDTFNPALMAALTVRLRPANNVTAPRAELTAAEIVMSPAAPVDVKLTLPATAATAPLTPNVDDVAEANNVMLAVPVVVTPLVVKLPVASVKLKFTPVKAALTLVDGALLVTVYAVSPRALSKPMPCVVLILAVTVRFARLPPPPCAR